MELKRSQAEYERRRNQLVAFYESVKHAQQVSVDEIPLPSIQVPEHISSMYNSTSQIPLPNAAEGSGPSSIIPSTGLSKPPPSILKRTTAYGIGLEKEPPGVPPGPPPDLSSCSEDEDEPMDTDIEIRTTKQLRFSDDVSIAQVTTDADEDGQPLETLEDESTPSLIPSSITKSKPTSLQQRMVALSGQNIDEFMKEMEAVHKNKDPETLSSNPENTNPRNEDSNKNETKSQHETMAPPGTDPQDIITHNLPPSIPPPTMLFRPQMNQIPRPVMPLMSMRLPPGPPPGRPNLPPGPPPGLPPRLGMRLPPGPPPGIPPRMLRMPIMPPNTGNMPNAPNAVTGANPNVLSAAPQLINRADGGTKQGATIMAKPQIRNLSADVTRFVPSALRVKREDKKSKNVTRQMLVNELKQQEIVKPASGATKDDAYMQFMREMEGLL